MINYKTVVIALLALSVMSCTSARDMIGAVDQVAITDPATRVSPELDYSDESPDCLTAANRLAENVEVGMPLDEVIRLVGKPRYKLPGSWWWGAAFSEKGVPVVKFQLGPGVGTKPVTSFLSETESCSD